MMRALLVAAFVIVAAGPALAQETTPRYERRTLDEWTQDLDDAAPAARRKAVFALGQFGSPALAAVTRRPRREHPIGGRLDPGSVRRDGGTGAAGAAGRAERSGASRAKHGGVGHPRDEARSGPGDIRRPCIA